MVLCLYTSKSVFVLDVSVDKENAVDGAVRGRVDSVQEPFDGVLLLGGSSSSWDARVVRVRPGPHQRHGYSVLCPGRSLAALLYNPDLHQYSLVLSHGGAAGGSASAQLMPPPLTTPVAFGTELPGDDGESVVDFCFAQSRGLGLLSSLAVLFLKGSTDVFAASPVAFHGTIVPTPVLDEAMGHLESLLRSHPQSTATWRQARIAQQYLRDVFPSRSLAATSGLFTTAVLFPTASCPPSASWQVNLQGPVLFASRLEEEEEEEDGDVVPRTALALEPFGRSEHVGIALAKEGRVDVGVISPTAVLPRFALESDADRAELDDAVGTKAAWVERVALLGSSAASSVRLSNPASLALVPDPTLDTLLHYVSPKLVATVSTTVLQETSRRLQGKRAGPVRTAAWSCLAVAGSASTVQGAAVDDAVATDDPRLVIRLSCGLVETVSVAETQIRHQVHQALLATTTMMTATTSPTSGTRQAPLMLTNSPAGGGIVSQAPNSDSVSSALANGLESTRSLSELVDPLLVRIQKGLAGMTKVVGTSTPVQDVTAEQLAVAIELHERCDAELALPLLELKRVVRKRRERLREVVRHQLVQVEALARSVAALTSGLSAVGELVERIQSRAAALSQRSSTVLLACQGLVPTLSQAEYEFFRDVKRIGNKTTSLEHKAKSAVESAEKVRSKLRTHPLSFSLTDEQLKSVTAMLDEQASTLSDTQASMNRAQADLKHLTDSLNLT
jgi:hypothetical protein